VTLFASKEVLAVVGIIEAAVVGNEGATNVVAC